MKSLEVNSIKGMNFDVWGGFQGFLDATSNGEGGGYTAQQLKRVVPWLAKATDMTANAVASLPFELVRGNGDVYDSSSDWKNLIGGMDAPEMLLHKLAASLCLGRAYIIPKVTKRAIVNLQYCAPNTITPSINALGLQFFDRATNEGKAGKYYPADGDIDPKMMYFWLPDSDVEIGPALSYPAGAALLSAKILFSMDDTIQTYSERGFVPATLLSAKGMPGQAEREKAENWWNRFLRGWTKEAAKIVNAEAMTVNRVGAGMEELKGTYSELSKQAIENVGTAYGIPAALFMSDMAYASEANAMIKVWYTTSAFVKIYKTIENTFNSQLLNKYDLSLRFRIETIDAFKTDEAANATAFSQYVGAGLKQSVAAQLVGLELPVGMDYEDLDPEEIDEPIKEPVEVERVTDNAQPIEKSEELEEKSIRLNADQIKELNLWRQIAERNEKKGKGRAADFECKTLPDNLANDIRTKLQSGCTIARAFEITGNSGIQNIDNDGLKMLAEAINKSLDIPEVKAPAFNISMSPINLTAQMPQQDQPNIVINVPEQQAPIVNVTSSEVKVTNEVNPTPVTIENNVKASDVVMPEKATLTVKRDAKGQITGMVKNG